MASSRPKRASLALAGFRCRYQNIGVALIQTYQKGDKFILVGFIWANVAVYRNVVVGNVLV